MRRWGGCLLVLRRLQVHVRGGLTGGNVVAADPGVHQRGVAVAFHLQGQNVRGGVRRHRNRHVYDLHINNTARSQGECPPRGRLEPSAIYAKSEPFVLLMLRQSTDRADRLACVVCCDAPCAFHSNTFVYFVWKVQGHSLLSPLTSLSLSCEVESWNRRREAREKKSLSVSEVRLSGRKIKVPRP